MSSSPNTSSRRIVAFTLLELMISVALVLVLMLGVNEVFRMTSDTVGAGQAVSGALRDARAAQQTMAEDFAAAAPDAPCLIITNRVQAAFRSADDKLSNAGLKDAQGNATDANRFPYALNPIYQDLNGDQRTSKPGDASYVPGEVASPAIPNSRMHRIDTVTFFVRRPLNRSTGNIKPVSGNPAQYSDLLGSTTSGEAMVTYGHLRVANNQFSTGNGPQTTPAGDYFYDPGEADLSATVKNDNNAFASQWILGRTQMLMVPRLSGSGTATYPGETAFAPGEPASASMVSSAVGAQAGGLLLTPLAANTNIVAYPTGGTGGGAVPIDPTLASYSTTNLSKTSVAQPTGPWESKIDLAVGSIAWFNQRFATYRGIFPDPTYTSAIAGSVNSTAWPWFLPAVSDHANGVDQYLINPGSPTVPTTSTNQPQQTLSYRGNTVPFAARNGASLGQTLAQTNPVMLPRVTQFIVEYAGDFISQDENQYTPGNPTVPNPNYHNILPYPQGARPDGNIDYVYFRGQKRIRWYGLPRYTGSGNLVVSGNGYVGPVVQGTATPPTVAASTLGQPTSVQATVKVGGAYSTVQTNPNINNMPDVVPLSDILTAIGNNTYFATLTTPAARVAAPFERVIMSPSLENKALAPLQSSSLGNWLPPLPNYADTTPGNQYRLRADPVPVVNGTVVGANYVNNANYICAWAGGGPKMIRITITLEDPNAKNLSGGKTFEYIFNLPY